MSETFLFEHCHEHPGDRHLPDSCRACHLFACGSEASAERPEGVEYFAQYAVRNGQVVVEEPAPQPAPEPVRTTDLATLPPDTFHDVYVPGVFRCPLCAFELVRTTLYVATGDAGVSREDAFTSEPCPNDGTLLVPVTWRDRATSDRQWGSDLMEKIIALTKTESLPAALEQIGRWSSQPVRSPDRDEAARRLIAKWRELADEFDDQVISADFTEESAESVADKMARCEVLRACATALDAALSPASPADSQPSGEGKA